MCLAEPGKVLEVIDGRKARVDFCGREMTVDTCMLSGLKAGDYVMAHGLLAIQKLDEDDAIETLRVIGAIGHFH
ncbi:MAG: HypC/HybG/HupF family hydrogenase formation chaperone [Candidatus Altiarchaeota archaeon]